VFLFAQAVFLLGRFTAREPCSFIGISVKMVFSVQGSRAVYYFLIIIFKFLQEKAVEASKQKEKKRKIPKPRNMKACHTVSTALLQNVAGIETHSTTKNNRKTLHEFTSHIPPNTTKGNRSSSTNEMLHTDVTSRAQRARVSSTHAM
jgi:hypothetical protein